MKYIFAACLAALIFLEAPGCVSSNHQPVTESSQTLYNKYNIHYFYKSPTDIKAHCANWTGPYAGHRILPPNSQVRILPWQRGFIVERMDNHEKIKFQFGSKFMNMSEQEYVDTIFSPTKVSLDKMSAIDQKGIKQGKALIGMTKKGIMTALGYPAQHKTPSLDGKEWVFWTNRFGKFIVIFDGSDKVVRIQK